MNPTTIRALSFALLAAPLGAQTVHRIVPDTFWNTLSRRHPVVARIKPGDMVVTRTIDASGRDHRDVQVAQWGNPMVGPIYVEGAESGDAIGVRFTKIRLNRPTAWGFYRLATIGLLPNSIEGLYPNRYKPDFVRPNRADLLLWELDTAKQTIRLREPVSSKLKLEFAAEPMLGVVGVAPAGDFAPTSGPSGPYGGNMDFNEVREGATLWLPVYNPGALLFVADGHALMADGEPSLAGIETSMDVEFTVELRKRANLTTPRLENRDYIMSIGSQAEFISSLDRALQIATTDMARWIAEDYGVEPWAAHQLINVKGEYEVITLMGSMALKIPKRFLPPKP
jgi:acetamidase/formamidase